MKDGHFGGFYGRKVNLRPNRFEIQRKLRKLLSKTQKAMRLAYCIHALNLSGGIERVLTTKANYLADVLGH